MKQSKIILASASPRRKELLEQIGVEFDVMISNQEEIITSSIPCQVVMELSLQKAMAVKELCPHKDCIVIGADTVVAIDGKIMGKPKDVEDAFYMLKQLQGNTHQVYTGVTILFGEKQKTFCDTTQVEFYKMEDEEIRTYISSGEPMDKAGAYGIQGKFAGFVKKIDGDYTNVVGLPLGMLYQELKSLHGID